MDFSSDDSVADETYQPNFLDGKFLFILVLIRNIIYTYIADTEGDSDDSDSDNPGVLEQEVERNSFFDDDDLPLSHLLLNQVPSTSAEEETQREKKSNLKWKNSNCEAAQMPTWGSSLPPEKEVETPVQYFRRLVDKPLLDYIRDQTNLYSAQADISSNFSLSSNELEQFLGVCFYMSLISVPGTRRYWKNSCRISQVADVIPLRRFEQIKTVLHFADNSLLPLDTPDRLFKVRNVIESIRNNMRLIPIEQHLSVDEQIVPYKGKSGLKQYNPKKPKKWGYKFFCLAGASGIVYDFEVYCGSTNQPENLPDISASSNVVIRLAERIPKNQNFLLFYDNWFCSPALQIELIRNGIHSLGTVRTNRVPDNHLPSDKILQKQGRGRYVEKVATQGNTNLRLVKWYDNKAVTLLSTFSSASPETTIKRYDRKKKEQVTIKCPSAILVYNKFMCGVDLIDSLLALYRTKIRSRKYYLRIFFHLMDMCVIIGWLWYRRACNDCGIPKRQQLSLFDFKADVAQSLCWAGKNGKAEKRGRPSSSAPSTKAKKSNVSVPPNADCRSDKTDHWPEYENKTGRCKNGKCQKITKVKCSKCDCYLCFVGGRNCFREFHK